MELTQEYLKQCMDYSPDTGLFTWRYRPIGHFTEDRSQRSWNTKYAGKTAGCVNFYGYIKLCIDAKQYRGHRLAFLWMDGSMPADQVDHINGKRSDNRWCNLRLVAGKINQRNMKRRADNTSGHIGVYWNKNAGKWQAFINVNSGSKYLGVYKSIDDAIAARKSAEKRFGFHENHGRN